MYDSLETSDLPKLILDIVLAVIIEEDGESNQLVVGTAQ